MVHLHVHSWFSFGGGASSPQVLAERAAALGQSALALTDDWSLAGAVQHARACRELGLKAIFGARVRVAGLSLVLLCADNVGYANLCDLLTLAHRERLKPTLDPADLPGKSECLFCLVDLSPAVVGSQWKVLRRAVGFLRSVFGTCLFVELVHHHEEGDSARIAQLVALANSWQLPYVATNAVRHARPEDFILFDALCCAHRGLTVAQNHPDRPRNEAKFLCARKYFHDLVDLSLPAQAIVNSELIAAQCDVEILSPVVVPPQAHLPANTEAGKYLRQLCNVGFLRRFPSGSASAVEVLKRELATIGALELDEFFLVVREVVAFARGRGIRCCGRGSAANSLVAYLLGITEVDPLRHKLLFERFLHEGRRGMPDIDVDFETHRRHEVIAWMEERFGPQHTAMTANVVTFRLRLATREMAKVLGFPLSSIDRLSKLLPSASARHIGEHRKELALALCGGTESPALDILCDLVQKLHGCPRHLSLHSGGMILSRAPLRQLSPLQVSANGVRQVQFAKDDIEALGLIKFDVLGLRMLSVISEAQNLITSSQLLPSLTTQSAHENSEENASASTCTTESTLCDLDNLPSDDAKTYELIRSGQTMGVFQIESPGQWHLLARSQPEHFDDLVAQVALFRPGPLQGHMVHPYVARRHGQARVHYLHPCLEPVLRDTYGVILFQEQVLEVAHRFAGLSLSEADEFRRLMSKERDPQAMEAQREQFVEGALQTHRDSAHPVGVALANRVFDLVAKFVGYGFCRSHAAAFARTVYQSAYLKAHFPAAYMAGILEHKPGFYPLQTLLEEARTLGVQVLAPCLLRSSVKYQLENDEQGRAAIRVPLTQIKEISLTAAQSIVLERALSSFTSLENAVERLSIGQNTLVRAEWENLARSGALEAFGNRRETLWQVRRALRHQTNPAQLRLEWNPDAASTCSTSLNEVLNVPIFEELSAGEKVAWDFATLGLTTGPHPLALHRPDLERLGATTIVDLRREKNGAHVLVGGAVIVRQRPPTAKGMGFLLLEDESGRLPAALAPPVYEKFVRSLRAPALLIEGRLQCVADRDYRSVLITRLWPLDSVCGPASF